MTASGVPRRHPIWTHARIKQLATRHVHVEAQFPAGKCNARDQMIGLQKGISEALR